VPKFDLGHPDDTIGLIGAVEDAAAPRDLMLPLRQLPATDQLLREWRLETMRSARVVRAIERPKTQPFAHGGHQLRLSVGSLLPLLLSPGRHRPENPWSTGGGWWISPDRRLLRHPTPSEPLEFCAGEWMGLVSDEPLAGVRIRPGLGRGPPVVDQRLDRSQRSPGSGDEQTFRQLIEKSPLLPIG
jgi:hypothetical protein